MGRKASALKATLKEECNKRNIGDTGSISQLIERLEKHEQKVTKTSNKPSCVSNTISKQYTPTTCKYSKEDTPVNQSAAAFIDCFYKGNADQAENNPEWVMGSNHKVKLMVPAWRNTKGGVRMRWVLFRGEE
ncbi:MAG: hypothetical protein CMB67_04550 [Euryarchaeota archaeon]|nr:hypothetical protein [Euryarchaeota archaeon]